MFLKVLIAPDNKDNIGFIILSFLKSASQWSYKVKIVAFCLTNRMTSRSFWSQPGLLQKQRRYALNLKNNKKNSRRERKTTNHIGPTDSWETTTLILNYVKPWWDFRRELKVKPSQCRTHEAKNIGHLQIERCVYLQLKTQINLF